MKGRLTLLLALALVAAAPAFAQKVNIDYDKDYDFGKPQTYQWVAPQQDVGNPLMEQRLRNAVDYGLSMRGARQVDSAPDVYVSYSTSTKQEVSVNSTNFGYGYGPGWYWGGGFGTTSTTVSTYDVGTLVIDIWDAKTKNLIWRGTATGTVAAKPEKMEKKINTAVEKLFDKWAKLVQKGKVKGRGPQG